MNISIHYRFIESADAPSASFAERDVFGVLEEDPKVLSIAAFLMDGESGTEPIDSPELRDFCDSHEDSLILYTSSLLVSEYPIEPAESEFDPILDRQESFLLQNGFLSINDYVGYEHRRAYVYNNNIGKNFIERIPK